jgi:hypothetical protein
MKSRMMRYARNVARVGNMRNAYKIWLENPKAKTPSDAVEGYFYLFIVTYRVVHEMIQYLIC